MQARHGTCLTGFSRALVTIALTGQLGVTCPISRLFAAIVVSLRTRPNAQLTKS